MSVYATALKSWEPIGGQKVALFRCRCYPATEPFGGDSRLGALARCGMPRHAMSVLAMRVPLPIVVIRQATTSTEV